MADNEALFTPELVFFDWECATPAEVFARLEGELAPRGYICTGWLDAVRTREDAYPTGLAMPAANIAIPHTDPGFVAKPYIAVVKPAAPVTFNAMAGMGAPVPAQIVINLGIAEPGGQVEALQALMNIFMDADVAADVLGQTTPQGMVDAIRLAQGVSPTAGRKGTSPSARVAPLSRGLRCDTMAFVRFVMRKANYGKQEKELRGRTDARAAGPRRVELS